MCYVIRAGWWIVLKCLQIQIYIKQKNAILLYFMFILKHSKICYMHCTQRRSQGGPGLPIEMLFQVFKLNFKAKMYLNCII